MFSEIQTSSLIIRIIMADCQSKPSTYWCCLTSDTFACDEVGLSCSGFIKALYSPMRQQH